MKILSFYYNENYKYILIVAIILILTGIYDDYFIKDKYFNNEEFHFLSTIFNYIGQFLTIFIYYKYKEKNKVNSTEINKLNYIIHSNNNNYNSLINLNFSFWMFNLIIFYLALIEFCHMLYEYGVIYIKSKKKITSSKYFQYYSLEPLCLFIFYFIIFYKKNNIQKHHKISFILVIIILIISFFLNLIYNNFLENFYYLINTFITSALKNLKLIFLKYFIEYYYFDGNFLNGYSTIYNIILYSLQHFLKNYDKIGKVSKNIFKILFSFNIFYLPIYIVFNFFINIYIIIIISDNPVYFGFIRLLKTIIEDIYKIIFMKIFKIISKEDKNLDVIIIEIIISIFLIIAMFIYCEFLQINLADMDKDTKKNIQKRAENEIQEINLYSNE